MKVLKERLYSHKLAVMLEYKLHLNYWNNFRKLKKNCLFAFFCLRNVSDLSLKDGKIESSVITKLFCYFRLIWIFCKERWKGGKKNYVKANYTYRNVRTFSTSCFFSDVIAIQLLHHKSFRILNNHYKSLSNTLPCFTSLISILS